MAMSEEWQKKFSKMCVCLWSVDVGITRMKELWKTQRSSFCQIYVLNGIERPEKRSLNDRAYWDWERKDVKILRKTIINDDDDDENMILIFSQKRKVLASQVPNRTIFSIQFVSPSIRLYRLRSFPLNYYLNFIHTQYLLVNSFRNCAQEK